MKSVVREILDLVRLDELDNEELIAEIEILLKQEKKQIAKAWLKGNEQGWAMETDWPEHGYSYYEDTFYDKGQH